MHLNKPVFWDNPNITIWSILLFPFSIIYRFIFFIKKIFTIQKNFSPKVICVGNIYLGGTGKTPLASRIANLINKYSKAVVIKKKYENQKDVISFLKKKNNILVYPSRVTALQEAINKKYNYAILDDGLQDNEIKKDISIVCFSSKQGIGNGHVLPSGPLRESLSKLREVDIVVINGKKNIKLEKIIKKKNKFVKIFYTNYVAKNYKKFIKKNFYAFSGIGNNINFLELLKNNNFNIEKYKFFPDHYKYKKKDILNLKKQAVKYNLQLITTEKDFLRLNKNERKNINFLEIELIIHKEKQLLKKLLNENN